MEDPLLLIRSPSSHQNKCVNCSNEVQIQDLRNLHQIFNFGETLVNDDRRKSSSSKAAQEAQLKLTIFEALDLVFQIDDEAARKLINTTDAIGLCIDCMNIFTLLFQLYLRFVSASSQASDSLIRHVLVQRTSEVQRYLQEYLAVVLKEHRIQAENSLLVTADEDGFVKNELFEEEFVLNSVPDNVVVRELKQEVDDVADDNNVEIDAENADDLINNEEVGETEEYNVKINTRRRRSTRQLQPPQRRVQPNRAFKAPHHPPAKKSKYKRKPRPPAPLAKCSICCESFTSRRYLQEHEKVHNPGKPNISCSICNNCPFNFQNNLNKHMLRAHPTAQIPGRMGSYGDIGCRFCLVKFLTESGLKLHLISKHLHCPTCDKVFSTKNEINSHMMESHEPISATKLKCKSCGYQATNSRDLKMHKTLVHGIDPSSLFKACTLCDKKFIGSHELKRHMAVHTDERPYKCDQCSMSFKHPDNLRGHKTIHDGLKFICEICGHSSSSGANLRKHVRGVHEGIPQTQRTTPTETRKKRFRSRASTATAASAKILQASSIDKIDS